jgi:MATE family multidrug resistance protein
VLFLREPFRREFATLAGWRPDPALFARLMKFGLPAGALICLDVLAFAIFLLLVGRLGGVALSATSIAFTLNFLVLFPVVGLGQAVGVVVGQRLGEGRVDEAARSTWVGARIALGFTGAMALVYAFLPGTLTWPFRYEGDPAQWAEIEALTRFLLRFVAGYCFFDSVNIVFCHALRGAGDTRFVTVAALVISWPVMIVPTWLAQQYGWGISWAWTFASLYIALLSLTFLARFLAGKWRSMRVIEGERVEEGMGEAAAALLGQEVTSA